MLTFFKTYFALNFLIVLMSLILSVLIFFVRRGVLRGLRYSHLLQMSYGLVLIAIFTPIILSSYQTPSFWAPKAQVWSSATKNDLKAALGADTHSEASLSIGSTEVAVPLKSVAFSFSAFIAIGFLCVGGRLLKDQRILKTILQQSFTIKAIGNVFLLASADTQVPFSAWLPFRSFVIVPQTLLSHPTYFRLIVKHELQHHRQRDTQWIYVLQLLKALCFWNPLMMLLIKQISDLQEVACDEVLIGHQNVSSKAYCDCLLWVAQSTLPNQTQLVGTASFVRGKAAKLLHWRIEEMLRKRTTYLSSAVSLCLGVIISGFMTVATAATNSSIQDRRISMEDAQKMANRGHSDGFPLVVNDLVLVQLNRFLGTPDGRSFMRHAIARMHKHESLISGYIRRYKLPEDLMAVPLIESGYRNLPQDGDSRHGAGLWMFIVTTAEEFGLQISDQVDERLDIALETDAAMRAFVDLQRRFNDWGLALLAYNGGIDLVSRGINETGSHNVWQLVRQGYENDPNYVASVIAAALIIKNPNSLND